MIPPEQNTQNKRRERIGRDQRRHFRLQEREGAAMAKPKHHLGHCELHEDDAKNQC